MERGAPINGSLCQLLVDKHGGFRLDYKRYGRYGITAQHARPSMPRSFEFNHLKGL